MRNYRLNDATVYETAGGSLHLRLEAERDGASFSCVLRAY